MVRSDVSSSSAIADAVIGLRARRRIWMIRNRRSARRMAFSTADTMLSVASKYAWVAHLEEPMVTLFGFGPAFGLPDPSPFVMKTDIQLKMAGVPYRFERAAPPAAPKGKIPFIEDGDARIGDSTFIRAHIEKTNG